MGLVEKKEPLKPGVKTPGQLAAEKSTAQAEAAALADRAGKSDQHPEIDNLTVVEHQRTIIEPSADRDQVLTEEKLKTMSIPELRAVVLDRGYGERRDHTIHSRAFLTQLILKHQAQAPQPSGVLHDSSGGAEKASAAASSQVKA